MITLTPEIRQILRLRLLQQLEAASSFGLTWAQLAIGCQAGGLEADAATCERESVYLIDKGLVALVADTISPEVRRARITAAGRDYVAERGLA